MTLETPMTTAEVAAFLRCSERTVRRIKKTALPWAKPGRQRLYLPSAVSSYASGGRKDRAPRMFGRAVPVGTRTGRKKASQGASFEELLLAWKERQGMKKRFVTTETPKPEVAPTYVYIIKAGDHAKVGFSKDYQRRLADIQVGNPLPCRVIKAYVATPRQERELHRHLVAVGFAQRGEWYQWSEQLEKEVHSFVTRGRRA